MTVVNAATDPTISTEKESDMKKRAMGVKGRMAYGFGNLLALVIVIGETKFIHFIQRIIYDIVTVMTV
jgi:hypothetical protein